MVSSAAATVPEYLASLEPERRKPIKGLRSLVRKHIPKGYKEVMQYGMISWVIRLSRYPVTYNGQPLAIASLASQKQYMSLYLMGVYGDPKHTKRFETAWKKSGKAARTCYGQLPPRLRARARTSSMAGWSRPILQKRSYFCSARLARPARR